MLLEDLLVYGGVRVKGRIDHRQSSAILFGLMRNQGIIGVLLGVLFVQFSYIKVRSCAVSIMETLIVGVPWRDALVSVDVVVVSES